MDVGIAEEYAVTLAAGMAKGGLKPFVAIYSTFLQRAYDQIMHDVCLQNLPVIFCLDRAGLVGSDGETHQGVFDLSYLSHMPNMTVLAPNTAEELGDAVDYAISLNSPVAIRYPKNQNVNVDFVSLKDSLWTVENKGTVANVIAVGPNMLKLARECAKDIKGLGVISARSVKPLDAKVLEEIKGLPIITLEENSVIGGFGALVSNYFRENGVSVKLLPIGVGDKFVKHGSVNNQLEICGLESKAIKEKISAVIG